MAASRADVFAGESAQTSPETASRDDGTGPGCPFAAIANEASGTPDVDETPAGGPVVWDPIAEGRVGRIPFFIRPMARRAIERYAEGKGYRVITESVMDEARSAMGM